MQYLQALKTTNLTEKDNYYPFYAGYNSLFHIQNGVEHVRPPQNCRLSEQWRPPAADLLSRRNEAPPRRDPGLDG